jgi:tetratricopeptide (TPR) repeat protein
MPVSSLLFNTLLQLLITTELPLDIVVRTPPSSETSETLDDPMGSDGFEDDSNIDDFKLIHQLSDGIPTMSYYPAPKSHTSSSVSVHAPLQPKSSKLTPHYEDFDMDFWFPSEQKIGTDFTPQICYVDPTSEQAFIYVARSFPPGKRKNWGLCVVLVEQAKTVLQYEHRSRDSLKLRGDLLYNLAFYLAERGDHTSALLYIDEGTRIREKVLGPLDPKSIKSLHLLASICSHNKSRLSDAEEFIHRAHTRSIKVFGESARRTLDVGRDVARVQRRLYTSTGPHCWNEQWTFGTLAGQALMGRDGITDRETSKLFDIMGDYHYYQGSMPMAEIFYKRALEGYEIQYGKGDPRVIQQVRYVVHALCCQDKYEEGRRYAQEYMSDAEFTLGRGHLQTANLRLALADCSFGLEQYDEAKRLYLKALEVQIQELGRDHSQTLHLLEHYIRTMDPPIGELKKLGFLEAFLNGRIEEEKQKSKMKILPSEKRTYLISTEGSSLIITASQPPELPRSMWKCLSKC